MKFPPQKQLELIKRNAAEIVSEVELLKKLTVSSQTGKPLTVKAGFDPTACDIHLGHTVLLDKLKVFQDLGHRILFLVGDFTAKIGDPSGKTQQRPVLSEAQIKENAATYTRQAFKILDKDKTVIVYNSQWYEEMGLSGLMTILSRYTVARLLERDDFSLRLKQNKPLSMLELIYPLIQGYDSVKLGADVEIGGTDQKFNLIVGRHLQESFGESPQVVITMPLLVGLDGKEKMSKSLNNYIGITESPSEIFGKAMSVSDESMYTYFTVLFPSIPKGDVEKMHPKEAKLYLASLLVEKYYSKEAAGKERERFNAVFSKKDIPGDIPVYAVSTAGPSVVDVLVDSSAVPSRNEARRLLGQNALTFYSGTLKDNRIVFSGNEAVLRIGKKKFLKVVYRP